jgi:predicted nucleotidyltransferase
MDKISNKHNKIKKVKRIIKEYLKELKPHIKIEKVLLFGSFAKRKFHKDSDIDLIIISPDFKKIEFMERLIWLSKKRGEKFMSPAMDILGYSPEEFEKISKESIVLKEAKEKGLRVK